MDGSFHGGPGLEAANPHERSAPDPLPEREWSLSAGQVVAAVLTIVALCEVIDLLS